MTDPRTMTQASETEIRSMIVTCRGFYRAITELDNVAAPHGSELQRDAHRFTGILQKTLDAALRDWSDGSTDPEENGPKLVECKGNGSGPWDDWSNAATREQCDVYAVENEAGLCPDCLAAALKYAEVSR